MARSDNAPLLFRREESGIRIDLGTLYPLVWLLRTKWEHKVEKVTFGLLRSLSVSQVDKNSPRKVFS